MTALIDLIHTLEDASAQDLDWQIVYVLQLSSQETTHFIADFRTPNLLKPHGGAERMFRWHVGGKAINTLEEEAPPFTTSVDAALTLIPEGWDILSINRFTQDDWWGVLLRRSGDLIPDMFGEAPTLPIAICIACLRASVGEGA